MRKVLKELGISKNNAGAYGHEVIENKSSDLLESFSPIDGKLIASVYSASQQDYEQVISDAQECFKEWRRVPAPERGMLVREIGCALRDHKKNLGRLVSIEMGKILAEGEGEVQEAIDICDFSVGL